MSIEALRDVVIIRRLAPEEVSAGGIFLAWDPDYKEDIGVVISAGKGKVYKCTKCKTEHRVAVSVRPGDKVLFSTNGHQVQVINGEELIVLREDSIIGVIIDGPSAAEQEHAA